MEIDAIKEAVRQNSIEWRKHALQRMLERDISRENIKKIILEGDIIKSYPGDKPYKSYLIHKKIGNRHLHLVVAFDEVNNKVYIITTYEPSLDMFDINFTKRRR
ncbi:MAG: DUF4258 domain-containing protein [Melioribacteraceae bacterium]